jgi:hypothetical protein
LVPNNETTGIYGPCRSVLDSLSKADSDLSTSQRRRGRQQFISRCHVADIAAVLLASMARPTAAAAGAVAGGAAGGSSASATGGGSSGQVAVYNVADDEPAGRDEVEAFGRQLLGLPALQPTSEEASAAGGSSGGADASGSSRGGGGALEEKRVSNAKVKRELGLAWRYPTYKEGLAAIAHGDPSPFRSLDDVRLLTGRVG